MLGIYVWYANSKNQDDFLTVVHLVLARNGLGINDGQVNRQPDIELAFVWP